MSDKKQPDHDKDGDPDSHVQGWPASQHDIPHDRGGATKVPDPQKIEQGTKGPEIRDAADKAEHPQPKK